LINRSPAAIAIGRLFQLPPKTLAILKSFESPPGLLPEDHPLIQMVKTARREHEQKLESAHAAPQRKRKGIGGPKPILTPEIIEKAKAAYLEIRSGKLYADIAYLKAWFKSEGIPCPSDSWFRRRIIDPTKPRR
jgi:hypothetical protein